MLYIMLVTNNDGSLTWSGHGTEDEAVSNAKGIRLLDHVSMVEVFEATLHMQFFNKPKEQVCHICNTVINPDFRSVNGCHESCYDYMIQEAAPN